MRTLILITLSLACAACTPKPDTGEDSGCDTGALEETGLPSTCEPRVWYWDADGDGYGMPPLLAEPVRACTQPEGYAAVDGDCDDSNASTYPGATDASGDGVDSDCDGVDG